MQDHSEYPEQNPDQDNGSGPMPQEPLFVFGGTGVIGRAFQSVSRERGQPMISVSLDPAQSSDGFTNLQADVSEITAGHLAKILQDTRPGSIVDLLGLPERLSVVVADYARNAGVSVAMISSCLLYDHDGSAPVDEFCRTVTQETSRHPYHLTKLAREAFWHGRQDVDWRIFRTHHVLGYGSLLGCVPPMNRDPELPDKLRKSEPIRLANGGNLDLSFVHPLDFARNSLILMHDPDARQTVLPLVNPVPVNARSYYEQIAEFLGAPKPNIVTGDYDPDDFWACTARNNVFAGRHQSLEKLHFAHGIADCIRDALTMPADQYRQAGKFMARRISGNDAQ